MTRFFLAVFFASVCAGCSASLPFISHKKSPAEKNLKEMALAYNGSDCLKVHELYEKFSAEKPDSALREKAYYYEGRCYEKEETADKAISIYKIAAELYPRNQVFPYRIALIYNATGFYDKALPLFQKVIDKNYEMEEALTGAARASRGLGKLKQAAEYYEAAVSVSGGNAGLIAEYAGCLSEAARFGEARAVIEKGIELKDSPEWAVMAAGTFAAEGRFDDASASMDIALSRENSREYRMSRAFYDFWAGKKNSAMAAAEKELSASPRDPLAAFLKGMILRSEGNTAEGNRYLRISACGGKFLYDISSRMSSEPMPPVKELCE